MGCGLWPVSACIRLFGGHGACCVLLRHLAMLWAQRGLCGQTTQAGWLASVLDFPLLCSLAMPVQLPHVWCLPLVCETTRKSNKESLWLLVSFGWATGYSGRCVKPKSTLYKSTSAVPGLKVGLAVERGDSSSYTTVIPQGWDPHGPVDLMNGKYIPRAFFLIQPLL